MSTSSTFGIFTTARLGIYSSQKAMEVVGNNISNINTKGYTRQALDQTSLYVGGSDRYQSELDARVGCGSLVTGVSQLRDPYLDIRYRNETSNVGAMDTKLAGLEEISSVLDEVAKGTDGEGVMEGEFNKLIEQLQQLATPDSSLNGDDTLVRSAMATLVSTFNTYASSLNRLYDSQKSQLNQDIDTVNGILNNIRDLNENIRRSEIHGGSALEMKDQRNLLIDELSTYMHINVTYSQEELTEGVTVEKLTISLAGNDDKSGNNGVPLIDGIYGTQLSLDDKNPDNFDIKLDRMESGKDQVFTRTTVTVEENGFRDQAAADAAISDQDKYPRTKNGHGIKSTFQYRSVQGADNQWYVEVTETQLSDELTLSDNDLYGSLQSRRELLTEKGEYATTTDLANDPDAAGKRGIPYYQKTLDALANKLATVLNATNKGVKQDTEADGTPKVDANGNPVMVEDPDRGGVLLSNNGNGNDTDGITASNISISKDWAAGSVKILGALDAAAPSTDNSNYLHILNLMTGSQQYKPGDTPGGVDSDSAKDVYFEGSFQEMFNHISATLADDTKATSVRLNNYVSSQEELYEDRDSVSGVDLNDEAMGMMQYQKTYSAACRLMTTVDSMLDKLINGMAV